MKQHYYASSPVHPFTEAELVTLLSEMRASNAMHDITGLLIYGNGAFVQVVEGPDAAVDVVTRKIFADARHEVMMRSERLTQARLFSDWRMGFVRLDANVGRNLPSYSEIFHPDFDLSTLEGLDPIAMALFEGIRASVREQQADAAVRVPASSAV